jgi:anti-sigma regulatory factor (Ser/Thr protein kinase)
VQNSNTQRAACNNGPVSSTRGRLGGAGGGAAGQGGGSAAAPASLHLDPDPAAAREARSWIVSALGNWPDAGVETARLLVTEVVTNAVLHARTPIEVCVRPVGSRIRFEIADEHPAGPLFKHFQLDAMTGRGLRLLDSMADEWGVARTEGGKVVWFTLGPDSDAATPTGAATSTMRVLVDELPDDPTLSASVEAAVQAHEAPVVAPGVPEAGCEADVARAGIKVVIKELPIAVYLEAEQHGDGLMREFAFMAQVPPATASAPEQPRRLLELAEAVRAAFTNATSSMRPQVEAALRSDQSTVDLELIVPDQGWQLLLVLAAQLDEIDRLSEQGELVTLASSPTVRRFRHWYSQQIADQVAGKPPQPWPGGT